MSRNLTAFIQSLPREYQIQNAIVQYVKHQYPQALLVHVSNEGKRTSAETLAQKLIGMLPGFPDLLFIYKERTHYIEVKTDEGDFTKSQVETFPKLINNGYPVFVVRSLDEAKTVIDGLVSGKYSSIMKYAYKERIK